jgi:hypothetical protein
VTVSAQAALFELSAGALIGLIAFGLVAGIGITAVGPGGVLVTVGLFVLTDLSPAAVAGTAGCSGGGGGEVASRDARSAGVRGADEHRAEPREPHGSGV